MICECGLNNNYKINTIELEIIPTVLTPTNRLVSTSQRVQQ